MDCDLYLYNIATPKYQTRCTFDKEMIEFVSIGLHDYKCPIQHYLL